MFSARQSAGGTANQRALRAGGGRDSNLFPLPAHSILKRSEVCQSAIDIFAVTFGIFFLCATACSVPVALFLLLFARF